MTTKPLKGINMFAAKVTVTISAVFTVLIAYRIYTLFEHVNMHLPF